MALLLLLFLSFTSSAFSAPEFPRPEVREQMLKAMAAEMARLDGEALYVRGNRVRTFADVTEELALEARNAPNFHAFTRVFMRLDRAYTNLHSFHMTGIGFGGAGPALPKPMVNFSAEWLGLHETDFRISRVGMQGLDVLLGDRVIAINGRNVRELTKEHFEFCKLALQEQCDLIFPETVRGENLTYTLERNGRIWDLSVPVEEFVKKKKRKRESCIFDARLYEEFTLVYGGRFACFFTRNNDPSTTLLRIRYFHYEEDESQKIQSVKEEVDAFWPWWKAQAPRTKHLIIDLADNPGGSSPVPYYQVLLNEPFQDQWVAFRKLDELLNEKLWPSIFWESKAQENWLDRMRKSGVWDATPSGGFLPPVPMFCVDLSDNCESGLFHPRAHDFRGRVSLVVNPDCTSTCDGFVFTLKKYLGDRAKIVGQPQISDNSHGRLALHLFPDATKGFRIELGPLVYGTPEGALYSQSIAITRAVDEKGESISGKPLPVDVFVPRVYWDDKVSWRRKAVKRAYF